MLTYAMLTYADVCGRMQVELRHCRGNLEGMEQRLAQALVDLQKATDSVAEQVLSLLAMLVQKYKYGHKKPPIAWPNRYLVYLLCEYRSTNTDT